MFVVVDRRDFPLISSADLVKFEHRRKFYDAIKNETPKLFAGEIDTPISPTPQNDFSDLDALFEEEEEQQVNKKRPNLEDLQIVGSDAVNYKSTFQKQCDVVNKKIKTGFEQAEMRAQKYDKKRNKQNPFKNDRCNEIYEQICKDHKSGQLGKVPECLHIQSGKSPFITKNKVEMLDFFAEKLLK